MSDQNNEEITLEVGTHWMCSCGKSEKFPFCDGAHKGTGKGPEKLVLEKPTVVSTKRPE